MKFQRRNARRSQSCNNCSEDVGVGFVWELVSASFVSLENKVFVVVFLLEIFIRRHVVVDGGVVVA